MRILKKYIIKETLMPFFLAFFVLTFVLLFVKIDRVADSVINKGVPIKTVLYVVGNMSLYLFHITIPIALMTAILLALGRMSSENEILALRSLGVSLHRLLSPIIVLSIIVSVGMLYMQDKVFPGIENRIETVFYNIAAKTQQLALREKEFIELGDYTFYIQKIDDKKIKNITVYEPVGNQTHRTITAQDGVYQILKEENAILFNLEQGTFDEPKSPQSKNFFKMRFDNYIVRIPLNNLSAGPLIKSLSEMTFSELLEKATLVSDNLSNQDMKNEYYKITNEFFKRITFSFAAFVLTLIAMPISIRMHRSEKSINFALALGIVVLYYVLLGFGEAITLRGFAFPFLSTSLPNIVLGFLGILMYVKLIKS